MRCCFETRLPWEDAEYVFRVDTGDFVEVEGSIAYNGSKTFKLLRNVEYRANGRWKPYPSMIFIDGLALKILTTDEEGRIHFLSLEGFIDGGLIDGAKENHIPMAMYYSNAGDGRGALLPMNYLP